MEDQKETPAGGTAGAQLGKAKFSLGKPDQNTTIRAAWKQKYYLHVHEDGREQRYRKEPTHVPTLTVEIVEDRGRSILERTWTLKVSVDDELITVQPRGLGWILETWNDEWASWLRMRGVS